MAYRANKNNVETILAQIEKNDRGDYVRATKIVNSVSGEVSYDIRNLYTDAAGEVQFTSKGVRLKEEELVEILKPILTTMDADAYNEMITAVEMANGSDEGNQTEDSDNN